MGEILTRKILMVGCGNMGLPILEAVAREFGNELEFTVINPSPKKFPVAVESFSSPDELPKGKKFDVLLLAVKPQIAPKILPIYCDFLAKHAIAISIMAGVSVSSIRKQLGNSIKIVRIMPNLGAKIGKSLTGFTSSDNNFSAEEAEFLKRFVESFGEILKIEENQMNAFTAAAGSGPAYVFYLLDLISKSIAEKRGKSYDEAKRIVLDAIMQNELTAFDEIKESFTKAAITLGFKAKFAQNLVEKTFEISALLARQSEQTLEELEKSVTSPGGTTEAGLKQLKNQDEVGLEEVFKLALEAAKHRADELEAV